MPSALVMCKLLFPICAHMTWFYNVFGCMVLPYIMLGMEFIIFSLYH